MRDNDCSSRGHHIKGHFTGTNPIRSGLQTTLIGGLAAAAAFLIARAIS
ncbi:MAG: hypothetical protein ACJ8AG_29865 [Ktedonobacteraceae bacterium]